MAAHFSLGVNFLAALCLITLPTEDLENLEATALDKGLANGPSLLSSNPEPMASAAPPAAPAMTGACFRRLLLQPPVLLFLLPGTLVLGCLVAGIFVFSNWTTKPVGSCHGSITQSHWTTTTAMMFAGSWSFADLAVQFAPFFSRWHFEFGW